MIQQLGKHRVRHGTVMDNDGISDLMQGGGADLLYSDPPWGQGNLNYWSTMNKKMTGEIYQQPKLEAFLDQIFSIAQDYANGYVCIEYGVRWADMIQEKGAAVGLTPLAILDIKYRGGKTGDGMLPLHLHVFTNAGLSLPDGYTEAVHGTHGWDCVAKSIGGLSTALKSHNPEPVLLDPCCGMGYSAKAAMTYDMVFRGNELNSARLQKTINRLK